MLLGVSAPAGRSRAGCSSPPSSRSSPSTGLRSTGPRGGGPPRGRRPAGAAVAVDPAVRRPGRHHRDQPGDRLPRRAGDRRAARRPAGGGRGARGRGARRRDRDRPGRRDVAHDGLRRAGPEEPRDRRAARTARATQGFQRALHRRRWPGRSASSTARRTRSCAGSASSRRRSCARPAASRSSPRWSRRSAAEGTLDAETAGLMERSVAFGDRTAGEIMTPRVRMHDASTPATGRRGDRAGRGDRPLALPGARRRGRRRGRHRPRQARGRAAARGARRRPGSARSWSSRSSVPETPAGSTRCWPCSAGGLPAGGRRRRVRRHGRRRDPRGRGRGDRRRHRRRARPARRAAPGASRRRLVAVRAAASRRGRRT